MQFTIERDTLRAAIETVAPAVVGGHATCMMVRLEVAEGDLSVQATNHESMIEVIVPAGLLAEAGVTLTPHATLAKLLPKLPAGSVEVLTDEHGLQIASKGFSGVLGTADPVLWPSWNTQEAANPVQITPEGAEMVRKVMKAAKKEDNKPSLTGIHFGSGQVEAADRERWARVVVDGLPEGPGIVIPATFLAGVLRTATSTLTMHYNPAQVYFSDGSGRTWASTVIRDEFPDTKTFRSFPAAHRATFAAGGLLEAIERLTAIAVDDYDPLVLRCDGETLTMALKSDHGEVVQDLEAVHDLPDGWIQGLNAVRFTDAVKAMGTDEVTVSFADNPMKPVWLIDGDHIQLMVPRDVNQRERQRADAKAAAIMKEQAKH